MKLSESSQQKVQIILECKRWLLEIKRLSGKKSSQIAEDLGVSYQTIWAVENEKSGSEQLLKALELLVQVHELKPLNFPSKEAKQSAEARANAVGLTLEDFCALSAARFGKELADELITGQAGVAFGVNEANSKLVGKSQSVVRHDLAALKTPPAPLPAKETPPIVPPTKRPAYGTRARKAPRPQNAQKPK